MKYIIFNFKTYLHKKLIRKFSHLNRESIASYYLFGNGLEIGAMDAPLKLASFLNVKYLDRCSKLESELIFPELTGKLVDVDIIFDIDKIERHKIGEFDFIIANHVLEHLENPIAVLIGLVQNLKSEGYIFLSLPDKRYTFDINRACTTIDHLVEEYEHGFEKNRHGHYFDFVCNTELGAGKSETEVNSIIEELIATNFSIHFHVWDHSSYIDFFNFIIDKYRMPLEIVFSKGSNGIDNESIIVLKKT
jgi:hypothetical protein